MNAWLHELYKVLASIPLIVVNCLPFARIEMFASKRSVPPLADGFSWHGLYRAYRHRRDTRKAARHVVCLTRRCCSAPYWVGGDAVASRYGELR
jgi:hypothetical protein